MPEVLFEGALKPRQELKSAYAQNSKSVVYETIRAKSKPALHALEDAKQHEGWKVSKRNKKSTRLERDKAVGLKLEDDVWCVLWKMGFTHLNAAHRFKIRVNAGDFRQVDVLAVDDETAIFVECTQSATPTRRSTTRLIQYIATIRRGAEQSVRDYFDKKLKVGWVIATRNIEWSKPDLDRASVEKIIVLRDDQIEYFSQLADHLKHAARYQFLAHMFPGQRISAMNLQVPATRAEMGGQTFYNFVVRPVELLKRAYVAHKANPDSKEIEMYQRLISRGRLTKIAEFLDKGGQFPTNIVINIHSQKNLRFELKERIGGSAVGTLYFPSEYGCAWIIDGQHRLFGYAYSNRAKKLDDKTAFPVLAYHDLPSAEEAKMFVDINHEQKSVQKNLLKEIYATLNWDSADFATRSEALSAKLVLELNKRITSALNDRIQVQGKKRTDIRCLTVEQISDPLIRGAFFGEKKPNGLFVPGPLSNSNSDTSSDTFDKAYEVLSDFFDFTRTNAPNHWNLGNRNGGFLATNMGVRCLLGVFRQVLAFVSSREHIDLHSNQPSDFMSAVKEIMAPLITHFEEATDEEVRRFRNQVGMAGARRNELEMMVIIKKTSPDFTAKGLDQHISQQDVEGTKVAATLINEIDAALCNNVIAKLKSEFGQGENEWWVKIPGSIRKKTAERKEEDPARRDLWNYLDLIDYRSIAHENWELFQNTFTLRKEDSSLAKTKRTEWIVKLNGFRQITHHPPKGSLSRDDVEEVKRIHQLALPKLQAGS